MNNRNLKSLFVFSGCVYDFGRKCGAIVTLLMFQLYTKGVIRKGTGEVVQTRSVNSIRTIAGNGQQALNCQVNNPSFLSKSLFPSS